MSKIYETFIENHIKNPNRNFEVFKILLGENLKEDKMFQSGFFMNEKKQKSLKLY